MEFNNLEDAWKQGINYGSKWVLMWEKKFINKSNLDGKVTSKGFICFKEGVRGVDKRDYDMDFTDQL